MSTKCVHLFGAGGHAKVVVDALRAAYGERMEVRLFDDNPSRTGSMIVGKVVEPATLLSAEDWFHVSIGTNAVRSRRFKEIATGGSQPLTIVHPKSAVASSATVEEGAFVAAIAIIGPDSVIGTGTIINHSSVVDHDCTIGHFSHIAPRAVLGGGVTIGERVLVGAGAVILPGLTVASDVVIGAGAVITRSITYTGTFIGMPAREITRG